MLEWWTYSPANFLMFSPRTYYRLFELHHRALWPAQIAAVVAAVAILLLVRRTEAAARRAVAALVASAWLAVAWSFFWVRFSTIHTGGRAMAAAFALQAALLAWAGIARRQTERAPSAGAVQAIGVAVVVYAAVLQPLVGRLLGRPWAQAELFGLTPDATVAATVGALLVAPRSPWFLWVIPTAWGLFSGVTLFAMQSPEWWLLPMLALGAATLEVVRRRRPRRG